MIESIVLDAHCCFACLWWVLPKAAMMAVLGRVAVMAATWGQPARGSRRRNDPCGLPACSASLRFFIVELATRRHQVAGMALRGRQPCGRP